LAGANLIYGAGMLDSGVTFDCSQLVIDDEIASMIKYAVGGIPVNDGTLMVEDIATVGARGDFLSMDSTLRLTRSQTQPRLIDRRVRAEWEMDGKSDMYARARAKALEIIESHRPEPLDAAIAERLRIMVADADQTIAGAAPA